MKGRAHAGSEFLVWRVFPSHGGVCAAGRLVACCEVLKIRKKIFGWKTLRCGCGAMMSTNACNKEQWC